MLRSHVIKAVFWRNLASYFSGVLGYLFIIVFVVACAATAFSARFFTNNLATLDQLSDAFPMLLLFIVPAVTMTSWAEERRQGTDELLFTLPATDFEILLGKYLAMLAVYTIALAFSGFNLFVLEKYADPDWGLLFTTYVGYWLAGGTLLAAGMFASVLTNSMTVAFVLGVVVCIVPVFGDKLAFFSVEAVPYAWVLGIALIIVAVLIQFLLNTPNRASIYTLAGVGGFLCLSSLVWFAVKASGSKIEFAPADFAPFGLGEQLRDFGLGLITLTSLVYFVSLTSFLLYLNSVLIGKRHWSGGREGATMGMQFVVRSVSLAVALVSLNLLVVKVSEAFPLNIDLTTEKLFTLSSSTNDLIAKITKDRPVKIQAFISADVPREQVTIQKRLKGLLRQYDRAGGSRLDVRFVDVAPFTPEAEEARLLGVLPLMVFTDEDGRRGTQEVFMGVVISSPVDEVVVPVFEAGTPIEYELTRSIRTVASEKRLTVGMLTTDSKVAGGLDMATFRQSPEWRIQTELKKQYKVEQVPADMPIDEKKYDVLMAVCPSSLNVQQMQNFVAYVKKGKPTLVFDDPLPYFDGGGQNAPRLPKPRPGGMFGGMNQPPEPKADDGKLTSLMRVLEIVWDNGQVVFDLAGLGLHPEFGNQISPELVFISPKAGNPSAIHPTSPVTSGLQEILTFFPGEIRQRKESELKFEALLRTRGDHKSGLLQWEEITRQSGNPFGGGGIEIEQNPNRTVTEDAYTIAAHITGKDSKDHKGINAIFVADSDLISNQLFGLETSQQLQNLRIDNIKFVLNCVDVLAGETSYIDLRKRRPQLRTLTAIQEVSNKLREDQTKERGLAESDAKDQFDKAQKRLDDAVAEIEKDTSLTPIQRQQKIQIIRETEQRKADVARATIEREKRQKMERIEAKTKRQIRPYEDQIRWWCIFLPPIPAVILGIIVLSSRINAEYRNVEADRLVKR